MHPTTLTEQAMCRYWHDAERMGTESGWYEITVTLARISNALRAAWGESDNPQRDRIWRAAADWDFLCGLAVQRAMTAARESEARREEFDA